MGVSPYAVAVVLSRRVDNLSREVVHEGDRVAVAVDPSLEQVRIGEEEQDGGQRRSLRQAGLW